MFSTSSGAADSLPLLFTEKNSITDTVFNSVLFKVTIVCFNSTYVLVQCLKPMAVDQVLSDRDSEDEVDDDIADFEDRRVMPSTL